MNRLQNMKESFIFKQKSKLQSIRDTDKFQHEEIKTLFFDDGYKYINQVYELIKANRNIYTHHNLEDQDYKSIRLEAAKMMLHLLKNIDVEFESNPLKLMYTMYGISCFDNGINVKTLLLYFLYAKSIKMFQSHPKHQQFLQKCLHLEDLGCFALTEFHHGSFTKGIVTDAHYDHAKQHFILNTHGEKGMKYWIGAASQMANMAIVWAQLIISNKSYGPHPFIVQIRDKKSHHVLPTIKIGDCGHKNGLNALDNGYIILEGTIIPRQNLLGRLGNINDKGQYITETKSIDQLFGLHMSPLSGGRALISACGLNVGLNALTIALRYACSRKQFKGSSKEQVYIIDYPITKHRLIPFVAKTVIYSLASLSVCKLYMLNQQIFTDPSNQLVPQLHAISAVLKAKVTWHNSEVISECRAVLGGHGYSAYSRLGSLYHDNDVNLTWEGDNNMLIQQTSKFLFKDIPTQQIHTLFDFKFLHQNNQTLSKGNQNVSPKGNQNVSLKEIRNLQNVKFMLQDLFKLKYSVVLSTMSKMKQKYSDSAELWDSIQPFTHSLSLTFGDLVILQMAERKIKNIISVQNRRYFEGCLYLWIFTELERQRYGSLELRKQFQKQIIQLQNELLNGSIILCDVIGTPSELIGSPFANYDGDGFKEYLALIYSGKKTFERVEYYEDILKIKW